MGISKLKSQTVFLDTAPLIYFIEGNSEYQKGLNNFFSASDKGDLRIITSALTLLEVLVLPIKLNRQDLVEQYKQILTSASGLEIIDINTTIAHKAAELRAKYNLKTPDAIQVATAIEQGVKYLLTNDIRLKAVKEVSTVTPAEL